MDRRKPVARTLGVVWFAALFLLVLPAPLRAQQNLTSNLLINPGAELGSLANWTSTGPGTPTVDSGTFDGGINPHTGSYDFLGHDSDSDSLSQTVSLTNLGISAATLDSGTVNAGLSFWEQGLNQGTPSDDAYVTLTFLDVEGGTLGMVNSGEVDSHGGQWTNFTGSYPLPTGTRAITYTMHFVRHAGSDLDGFVDDNSLILTSSVASGLTLSATRLNFGNQTVGVQSAPQVLTATNAGTATINIAAIALQLGANPSDFAQTNNCPAALVAGASCQISVTFTPHGVGSKIAGLEIDDDSNPSAQFVTVSGTGTGGILQVNPGNLKTIAGTGTAGYAGDGGAATAAQLNQPDGIGFDLKGNLYITDVFTAVVRKVDPSGNITTFAGNGTAGYMGDGGAATSAELNQPYSVTADAAGNVYIQDTGNNVIRKVDTTGKITTFAGTGTPGHAGDGGPATSARFNQNQGARFDQSGNFFVPQCGGASIRRIDPSGIITTVAGNFTAGFSGDGGPATSAQLSCPSGVAIDAAGNFYIADYFNQRIRKVDTHGTITTIAGDGNGAFLGDGGPAVSAEINLPNDIALDTAGNLYIADSGNNRVRKIDTKGIITTVAGGLQNAGSAGVNTPLGLAVDASGNLFFSDSGNSAVREVFPAGASPFPATPLGTAATPQTLTLSNIGNLPVTIAGAGSFLLGGNAADFSLSGGSCLAGVTLTASGGSCTLQVSFSPVAAGLRMLSVSITDNALNSPQSFTLSGTGTAVAATLNWAPPANIVFGTPLGAAQLNATASGVAGAAVAGTFVYTPAAGTVLTVGPHVLSVTFTPTDPSYLSATATVPITVTQAATVLTWPAPASIAYGIPLSAAQLNATVSAAGAAVPGTFTYTPAAGTVLPPGPQTLSVSFTPTDPGTYTTASGSVPLTVTGLVLGSIAPSSVPLGAAATTLTLTGSGFVTSSVVQVNGTPVATTYVNPTTLTAVVPATNFLASGALAITVSDPTITAVSAAQTLTVIPASPNVTLSGPSVTAPGSQPSISLTITNPYPLSLTAVFSLSFAGAATPSVDDPAIQFAAGGRTLTIVVPANSTVVPPIPLQAGTEAGTITIPVVLTAGGVNVTPAGLAPLVIVVPGTAPVVSTVFLTRNAGTLSVAIHGFSNTREVKTATFHFVAASGATVATPDLTAPVGTVFAGWFSSAQSPAFGSTFTYTQVFNVSDDAKNIGSVQVTLTNAVGTSSIQSAQ